MTIVNIFYNNILPLLLCVFLWVFTAFLLSSDRVFGSPGEEGWHCKIMFYNRRKVRHRHELTWLSGFVSFELKFNNKKKEHWIVRKKEHWVFKITIYCRRLNFDKPTNIKIQKEQFKADQIHICFIFSNWIVARSASLSTSAVQSLIQTLIILQNLASHQITLLLIKAE